MNHGILEIADEFDKAADEQLFRSYRRERDWHKFTHAQIVADGCYGARVEAFAMRYSLEEAEYADMMIQRDKARGWLRSDPPGMTPCGRERMQS